MMKFFAAVLVTLCSCFTADAQCPSREYSPAFNRGYNSRFNIQVNRGFYSNRSGYNIRSTINPYARNYGYRGYNRSYNRYGW